MNEKAVDKTPPAADEYQATLQLPTGSPQVQPPFQDMRDGDPRGGGVCSGGGAQRRGRALLTLLSL